MKGRLLIVIFISICFIAGSCNVSSVQGSRYNFSSLDSVIQGWVSKEYYPGASISEIVKGHPLVVKQGRVEVGNGSLYYEEAGWGEPVIFVHGHSLDHRMWDEQFPVFAKKYRVIRYDLRGYGISSSQTEDYQFTHAEDLVTLMDSLHIKKAHIVGLSLGGFITADMLAYFPDRMLSAFLASGNIRKSKGPSEPMTPEVKGKLQHKEGKLQPRNVKKIMIF